MEESYNHMCFYVILVEATKPAIYHPAISKSMGTAHHFSHSAPSLKESGVVSRTFTMFRLLSHGISLIIFTILANSAVTALATDSRMDAMARDAAAQKLGDDPWSAGPSSYQNLHSAPVSLIPYPRHAEWIAGQSLTLPTTLSVACQSGTAQRALARLLEKTNLKITSAIPTKQATIDITIDTAQVKDPEGYQLKIDQSGVTIIGHDAAGAFYAVQTLGQMLRTHEGVTTLPLCTIDDAPAFRLRGFMHDTGRNFQTIDSLKSQIDRFAAYKINTFHWHLTDNPAWRPESKVFPQLNDPKFRQPGRDPQSTYSFAQIRDLIAYAKERHVMVIPELDMPGHSEFFQRTFGFAMGTPQGIDILEKLLDEFCAEISKDDCPYLHLGADEVHIPNPQEFVRRMTAKVKQLGRTPILWIPGLAPTDPSTHVQAWGDYAFKADISKIPYPLIDSGGGYLNSMDPQNLPHRYFFWQACKVAKGDTMRPGGILCLWPDVRVDDKSNIFRHSPVWPTMLAFSESIWQGRKHAATDLMNRTPRRGSEAWIYLREFEARLADHRDRYFANEPFPWIKQGTIEWQRCGPFPHEKGSAWDQSFAPETHPEQAFYQLSTGQSTWQPAPGTTFWFAKPAKPTIPATYYLRTWFHCDAPRTAHFMVGFEYLARSQRRSGGIPAQGKWDGNGGSVWINGKQLTPPVWKNPGMWRFEHPTWGQPANEIPITDEEQYWCREPIAVKLNKGDNLVLMRLPITYADQPLQGVCAPVRKLGNRWVEDESIENSPTPSDSRP